MPGQHAEGYQADYQAARGRLATWARRQMPSAFGAARGHDVDPAQLAKELRAAADRVELDGQAALPAGPER